MKKTGIIVAGTLIASALLIGCGHKHEFLEATCNEPATCIECGETEGEALGHDFEEATCEDPKTCSRCGKERGEALGHIAGEANYQEASVCERCGEELESKLTPDFEKHGLKCNGEVGVKYDYVTTCYDDTSYQTVGTFIVDEYECFKGNNEFPKKEGYTWIKGHLSFEYTDDNAWEYGYMTGSCDEDYYAIEEHDQSVNYPRDLQNQFSEHQMVSEFKVNYYGEDYPCIKIIDEDEEGGWVEDRHAHYGYTFYYQIPDNYDGVVVGAFNHTGTWEDGKYIYDYADSDSIFVRLDASGRAGAI